MKAIWMKVTDDKYELPVAVADSAGQLARMCGVSRECIQSAVSHSRKEGRNSIYKKVEIEEGEEDEQS